MKPAFSYYGGKQNLINYILPLIPKHKIYVQPFIGGGTVFFAKDKSEIEYINDISFKIINFYNVVQNNFKELQRYFYGTVHAEFIHKQAQQYIKKFEKAEDKKEFDLIKLAWATWVDANLSIMKVMTGGFAFSKNSNEPSPTKNRVERMLTNMYYERLKNVHICNEDAIDVIKRLDSEDTFFYLDPPYDECDCGFYEKQIQVFHKLLDVLPNIKGKYLLSSYPSKGIIQFRKNNKVICQDIKQRLLCNRPQYKIECLTRNYQLEENNLF